MHKTSPSNIYIYTSLNPMPNAQVCVFDGTYYKITTTNYISKTSLYTTFCKYPSGPWPLKILMFALLVTREIATSSWPWEKIGDDKIYVGFVADIDIKILGVPPPSRAGHAFPRQQHMQRGGGYLFRPGFSSLYDAIHGWMTGRTDRWKASRKTTTMPFTISNI
jgi:hypothetical protein